MSRRLALGLAAVTLVSSAVAARVALAQAPAAPKPMSW
jgi:hypothetical protein